MELHENTEKQERALLVAVDTGTYQNCGRRSLWSHDTKKTGL